ncbi:MAG TPA: hypothetical protein VK638_30540 [Edaphobacter sp.]|nr:hypothetical protein [Edaphobacter sp.]
MQMWATARYDLHLSDDDFYALTPRQFDALLKRYKRATESNELLFAQLTSWIANTGFRSTEKPTTTEDFMPSRWSRMKPTKKKRKRSSIAFELRTTMACFMGSQDA